MRPRFEDTTIEQVHLRTGHERQVQRGKPLYFNRPWTQLHDEMLNADVKRVGDLPASRVKALRAATRTSA
jgi:hypothetical protein